MLVIGRFKSRTRTTIANTEALVALRIVGPAGDVSYILGAPSTPSVVKIKMTNWSAVTKALAQIREVHLVSEWAEGDGRLWALRIRPAGEITRTAPASRAHSRVREVLDEWRQLGWTPSGH